MNIIPGFIESYYENEKMILHNKFTGAKISLDHNYIDSYLKIFDLGTESIATELEIFLKENGFLFLESEINSILSMYYNDHERHLKIILLPTEKCNFRCTYCYEEHDICEEKNLNYDSIFHFVRAKLKNKNIFDDLSLMWFGGEPLIKSQEVISFTKRIGELCKSDSIKFYSSMTTNGYLLGKKLFGELLKIGITEYQITMDGDLHDINRPLCNGAGTFSKLLDNISNIHQLQDDFDITIRVNLSNDSGSNDSFYSTLAQVLENDHRFHFNLHSVFPKDGSYVETTEKEKRIMAENQSSMQKYNLKFLDTSDNPIYACYGTSSECFTFRPNGSIVRCTVALSSDWNKVGEICENECHLYEPSKLFERNAPYDKCFYCLNITRCPLIYCARNKYDEKGCNYEKRKIQRGKSAI